METDKEGAIVNEKDETDLMTQLAQALGQPAQALPEIPPALAPVLQTLLQALQAAQDKCETLERTLAFYQASVNAIPNPIFIKDENLQFLFFNSAYRAFFGLAEHENIGKRVQDLAYLSEEDRARYHREDTEMLRSLSTIQYEVTFQTADQGAVESLYWSRGFDVPETGSRGLLGEIVDISAEKKTQNALAQSIRALEVLMQDAKDASNTDPLTKLYNRHVMTDEVPLVIQNAETVGRPVCTLLIDIDHFKHINDTYGHPFGDEVLQRFTQILKETFRHQDIAARYGGDEFILILPGSTLNQARTSAERLRKAVCEKLLLPDDTPVTISIGVAQWRPGDTLSTFITRADEALYCSKRSGRNQVSSAL